MRWTMTSVSLLVWKMEPRCSSLRRQSAALVRLPLWPTAIFPLLQSIMMGWALRMALSPAGEFRECAGDEDFFDLAHGAVDVEVVAVAGDDAGGFLAAMLERVEAEVGE